MKKELLHFTADWCKPCEKLIPIIEEFVSQNSDITYTKINVDQQIEMTQKNNIMSVPTLILKVNNVEVQRHKGIATKEQINNLFS